MPGAPSTPSRRTRRDVNLEATRATIVAGAGRLFLARGYGGTTLGDIAAEASVAVQTIYNAVGGKAAVLTALFEATVAGEGVARSVPEIMRERTRQVKDARGLVRLLAEWFTDVHQRMAALWQVIEEGAAHHPEVAAFARERSLRRLANYEEAARELKRRGGVVGLELDEVAALIWSVGHPRTWQVLVVERGWTPDRYRRWVERALGAALLRP